MNEFSKKYLFLYYPLGGVLMGYGAYIVITGEAGRLISAGEGRYWVGAVFLLFGLYIVLATYLSKK